MLDMLRNAVTLFLRGKLFRDNWAFFRQWSIGFIATLALILVLGTVNPWLGAIIGGLIGGGATPWLFKDLKYN